MKFLKIAAAALLLAAPISAANAATFDFGGPNANLGSSHYFTTTGGPGVTVTAGADGFVGPANVQRTSGGLGVNTGFGDLQPGMIDTVSILSQEYLHLSFDWAVNLVSFSLNSTNDVFDFFTDRYDLKINDGDFVNGITALALNPVGVNGVKSLVIRASSTGPGVSDFKLAGLEVAAVPVPAAGLLLAGALGGLAVLRRRKTA